MKIIPFDNYDITTEMTLSELVSTLNKNLEPKIFMRTGQFFSDEELKPFEGKIVNDSFTINRIIKYRNPFLPKIIGKFESHTEGKNRVKVKMRPKSIPLIFIFLWSLGPTLFFFVLFNNSSELTVKITICTIWFIIGYLFLYFPYNYERKIARKFLNELFIK